MKKKAVYPVLILLFVISFLFMVYYGQKTFVLKKADTNSKADFLYHFVLIPEEENNEYWRLIEEGARDAAKIHRVYLEYIGPKRADMSEHAQVLDKVIASKVDGIMTQGISDKEFTPLINKALDKGISVITVDTDEPNSRREAYVGTDNYRAGYLAGQAIIRDTKGEQKVGVVIGRLDASHQLERLEGFMDAIKDHNRIRIAGIEESKISKTGSVQAAYDLLKENPDITAFYGTSALDGIGITQVVRTMHPDSDPYIITFDTLPETLKLLEKGEIDAIVVQKPYEMGYRAVEILVEMMKGKHPEKIQYTETSILREKDLPAFYIKENKGVLSQ